MKQIIILIILICFLTVNCQNNSCKCDIQEYQITKLKELDSLVNEAEVIKGIDERWTKFEEPSIMNTKNDYYRFTVDNLFGNFKIFRIEKSQKNYKVIIKEYDDTGTPNYSDTTIRNEEYLIPETEWIDIASTLNENCFWTMPYSIDRGGLDGSVWTLEANISNKNECTLKYFHHVSRWSPIDTTFILMSNKFMELGNGL